MYPQQSSSISKLNNVRPRSSLSTAPSSLSEKKSFRKILCAKRLTNFEITLCSFIIILVILLAVILTALIFVGKSLATLNSTTNTILYTDKKFAPKKVIFNPTTLQNHNTVIYNYIDNNNTSETSDMNSVYQFGVEKVENMSKILQKLSFRLPKEIIPIKYDLFVHPNLNTKTFNGNVTILLNVNKPIDYIAVHSKKLQITTTNVFKLNENGMVEPVKPVQTFQHNIHEYWVTEFSEYLSEGNYLLKLIFNGSLTDRIVGLYQSSYFDKINNQTRWIATSKFEPTYARQAFPCFDEPAMKAKFKVTLMKPNDQNYSALSNMNIESEIPEGEFTKVVFNESVKMSTYLACFIVSDFLYKEQEINTQGLGENFQMRVYATPGQLNKVDFALETGAKITEFYIQYFKIPYPLPKLDMAAIPDFVSGAMEHWGLVTFRETALLYDSDISSTANKQRVGTVVAHELAHMWFGNLVTMKWWNDLWLNEGFATYIEYKGVDHVHPSWKIMNQFITDEIQGVLKLDATLASHPIVQTVENPDQITEIFDSITYSKGASVIRMLEDFVGSENFQKAVTKYLNKYKYGNAVTDDLLTEIESLGLDIDIKLIMQTWTEQMGLPVLNVIKINETEYKLTQKRFLANPEDELKEFNDSPFNYRWTIPVTYFTNTNDTVKRSWFKYLDNEEIIKLDEPVEWIKFNKDQIGYYRVNYDAEMWQKLTNALIEKKDQFSISDRGHLLNDVFALADASQLPYSVALDLTKYLRKENEYVPWYVAASKLSFLKSLLMYTDAFPDYMKYSRNLVSDIYDQVGWNVKDDHSENLLRTTILDSACALGLENCLLEAADRFKTWLDDKSKIPRPDLRQVVYYHGMKKAGNEDNWNKMWNLFLTEQDANEKTKLMIGLAGIESSWILKRYIDLAWDEKNVRGQDYFTCMGYIAANPIGEGIVWDYIRDNWQKLVDRFGLNERYLGRLIPTVTARFSTEIKLNEMKHFFEKYPNAGAGTAARKQAQENVKINIKWLESNKDEISQWLKKQ